MYVVCQALDLQLTFIVMILCAHIVFVLQIAGFTAWSSVREPSQVFILLETVYRSFDQIAKKRRVFKVHSWLRATKFVVDIDIPFSRSSFFNPSGRNRW